MLEVRDVMVEKEVRNEKRSKEMLLFVCASVAENGSKKSGKFGMQEFWGGLFVFAQDCARLFTLNMELLFMVVVMAVCVSGDQRICRIDA